MFVLARRDVDDGVGRVIDGNVSILLKKTGLEKTSVYVYYISSAGFLICTDIGELWRNLCSLCSF